MASRQPLALQLLVAVLLATCALRQQAVSAFPRYQERIPNAGAPAPRMLLSIVPAPFGVLDVFCESVGHAARCDGAPSFGGNPFGRDFHANEGVWNETICTMDSDGDGVTNAEELGDPDCMFTPFSLPQSTTNITHPGFICSVVSDPFCLKMPVDPTYFPTSPGAGGGASSLTSFHPTVLLLVAALVVLRHRLV